MKGVLLVNLGSPYSTETKDVRDYLGEFLMDERVIDLPKWFRSFLVKGIILKTRPKKSAKAYRKIWWKEGSPLIVLSERLQKKVQKKVSIPVALAMRYGTPSIHEGLKELADQGVTEVFLVPLYPQFAMATTETILVLAEELREKYFPQMEFTSLPAFYNHPDYIRVLGNSIQKTGSIFYFPITVFRTVILESLMLQNHIVKWTVSVVLMTLLLMHIAIVISVR